MAVFSFDIVSEVNWQEVLNAVNQARKELAQRYDFKGSHASVDLNEKDKTLTLQAEDDYKLRALRDMVSDKMVKRSVPLKNIQYKDPENAAGGSLRQTAEISSGLPKDKSKDLVKNIKTLKVKVQVQIEGDKVRVSGPKKDDLQKVIAHVRSLEFPLALDFVNFR